MTKVINSPVLLIAFNRPSTTQKVFDAIKIAKPKKFYIAVDAPRAGNVQDVQNVLKVKEIVTKIDWECDVHTKFEDKNLGCGPGPASAISWVFEHEDRAIILEDDCVPAQSFFPFCDELLERYKDDERVWTISGNNFYEEIELPYSYIFSNYGHSWGWATWRRCWKHFDSEMNTLREFLNLGGFTNVFLTKKEGEYFNKIYKNLVGKEEHKSHIWDIQFNFTIKSNSGLSIVPAKHLVNNIGIQGTHSITETKYHNRSTDEEFCIKNHPNFILPYNKYDYYSFMKHYGEDKRLHKRIIRKLKKVIKRQNK